MKKIITLVTMFVLSAGCLMAQGVFTYQAVVYDGTSLVVDQDVTATVTITDAASHSYTQNFESIHTSPNGLAMLPIGEVGNTDFASIDWSTAQIKVVFNNTIGATAAAEQIPAVPYALQSNAALNTQMVADYIRHADMQAVLDILAATEDNVIGDNLTLHDAVLAALVDSVKNNYPLVKEIMLSYIDQANADDAAALFTALTGNTNVMNTLASEAQDVIMDPVLGGKEMIYEVLVAYASQLTDDDVQAILNAIPTDARNEAISKALQYFLGLQINYADEDIHAAMEEIAKYYIEHISTTQVTNLINTIEGNESAMSKLEPQLYAWIDEYVHKVINEYLNENYYYCEGGAPDLCAVWNQLNNTSANNCFIINSNTFNFEFNDGVYVGELNCADGSGFNHWNSGSSYVDVLDGSLGEYDYDIQKQGGKYIVTIYPEASITLPTPFSANVVLQIMCDDHQYDNDYGFTGTYTQGGGSITPSVCLDIPNNQSCFAATKSSDGTYTVSIPYTNLEPNEFGTIYVDRLNTQNFTEMELKPQFTDCYTLTVNSEASTIDLSFSPCDFEATLGVAPQNVELFEIEFNVSAICTNSGYPITVHVCYGN